MDFIEDVAVELRNVENDDLSDSDFINRRVFEWRLTFVVRANFYGPVREQGVIKKSIIDIGIVEGDDEITREVMAKTPRVQRFTAVPNPLDTIPDENGEFGVSETFQEFHDGKKFDPETGEDVDI